MQLHSCDLKSHILADEHFPIIVHDIETGKVLTVSSVRKTFVGRELRTVSLGVRVAEAQEESAATPVDALVVA